MSELKDEMKLNKTKYITLPHYIVDTVSVLI